MSIKKYLLALCAATSVMAAQQEQPTPYDLIRPTFPLTWDSTVFDRFDTTVTKKHNMVPRNRTPAAYAPNALIPDTLNQAYLDAINVRMSPIRVNQAGYLESDLERQFYYIGNASSFEVVDVNGKSFSPAVMGSLTPSGQSISSDWTIIAGTNAATNDQKRYQVDITGQAGKLMIGHIPQGIPTETRLRIKVGNDFSSTFIISNKVYSMVKDAALKFYGINRSGDGDSWFHAASHMKDGAGAVVTGAEDVRDQYNAALAGTLQGGYYDCGDHLKESQTQMYAFMVAAVLAATNADADEDHYAFNHGETVNTDGMPDMLREAKHGADYVLRAYIRAKGVIDDMALSVGNFGSDHGWWGRPENSDKLPVDGSAAATDRGGPMSRTVRLGEIGANIGGETAAGLALVGKLYSEYPEHKAFADSCLKVAKEMYDFAKSMAQGKVYKNNTEAAGWSSPAYNGNNEYFDDLALASVALWYATGDSKYGDDAIRSKTLGTTVPQSFMENCVGCFDGGWFVTDNKGFLKNVKNTSWANAYAYATYALYKLILADENKAINEFGMTKEERLNAIEDCIMSMIHNLSDVSAGTATITLPRKDPSNYMVQDIGWKGNEVKYDPIWYSMQTDQTWIYNRYQAGNIFEVLAYADVAKDIEKQNLSLPNLGTPNWKADEMFQLGINQLNYLLGVNPWDVSYILGIGDKNDAHPHHRAANPEGKNQPGAAYKYNPPVGALYGGVTPGTTNSMVPDNKSWEDYHKSETCIDAAATLVSSGMIASAKFDRTAAPDISVEIRHVSMDSAIVMIKLTQRGTTIISYGTTEGQYTLNAVDSVAGIQHEMVLRGLTPGTTYYFYVTGSNAYKPENSKTKFLVDSTQTPFTFTTLSTIENANIANVTVCNVSADSAEIMWYTPNGEYESKIYWDTIPHSKAEEFAFNTGTGNADVSGIPTQFHYVKIGGLKEKTTYYFMVESNGVQTNVDDKGNLLKFTTPVGWYDFSVRAYQYEFGGTEFLNLNIYNNEARAFDSLTLRMYFSAKPEEVEKCATLIDSDICQAYDEAGFNKPCENDRELRDLMRAALPVRLDDTYNPTTGKYSYYFPVPLGSSIIKSQSRLRVDLTYSSGISNDGYKTCETLRAPAKKHMDKTTGDWSWAPHEFLVDGADYDGMPQEDKDYGDLDNDIPVNPYIVVYRKNEFIWGFSPSKSEMETKKANYQMDVTFDPPFNVSNGSHIDIDQTSSTVHVTGYAHITEGGYVTKIWANGVQVSGEAFADGTDRWLLNEAGTEIIAKYNMTTDMWDLDIPVKMGIGSNKIDITIFAGPNPTCEKCSEGGGCAFENRNYYINFSKGDATASTLVIKDAAGNPITSPANTEGTVFFIDLMDKDKIKGNVQTLEVQVLNNKKNDVLKVTLTADAANPGHFVGGPITAVSHSKETRNATSEISFFAGDTIQVVYTDPDDEDDVSKQTFYAESKVPSPQTILAEDSNCDNKADQLRIVFTNKLSADYPLDSIRYFIEGMSDTVSVPLVSASYVDKNEILIALDTSLIPTNANPSGKITTYVADRGVANAESAKITDGILPTLVSVSILEKSDNDDSGLDTVMIAFSEPVIFSNMNEWPLVIAGTTSAPTLAAAPTTTNNGKSWQLIISGNVNNSLVPIGALASAKATGGFMITDQNFNQINPAGCNPSVPVTLISRPVPVYHAEMIDIEGDGIPDKVYIIFERKLKPKDVFDSIVTIWGDPGITRSFITTADTTGGVIVPKESYWTIRDTISAPFTIQIDSVTTKDSVNTYSIIEITIPANLAYPYGSTSGDKDGNGTVSPLKGAANGFFETNYTLYDNCAPVVSSARMIRNGVLSVTISEPVTEIGVGKYIQRERDEYIPSEQPNGAGRSQLFSYNEKDNVFHAGDRVRLVPQILGGVFVDKNNLAPTTANPYVRITGDDNIRFAVNLTNPVTTPKLYAYAGRPATIQNDAFIATTAIGGKYNFISGDGTVIDQVDTAAYYGSGPNFEVEIVMPAASFTTRDGKPMYDIHLKVVADLYDNLGQYINTYKLDIPKEKFAAARNLVDNGTLKLNLEWAAKDNEAPVSKKGNKIGTGAYIAKFDFTAETFCATTFDETTNDYKAKCSEVGARAEKATDSKTKTFGFKRRK
ncbi:glycoside hydrolase family 9 protein [Fibrobacter succinogenes]|uniref:Glycosyl hydrolase family 9 n=1 Tax=Fibrobacter succinogenes TaxID=833 RepID=A0A380RUE5_FIBSU|nr:glycoside hydrolase family 9 protein [Fibrobacter succinogenes]PWJ36666.1 glycosyl hydrolase family 9 [Fibrobacter succinogenes subsp. elongatus]SUQ18915.1 Glycosyl hydrolase family 9 [Fibrobacter succinogenes]